MSNKTILFIALSIFVSATNAADEGLAGKSYVKRTIEETKDQSFAGTLNNDAIALTQGIDSLDHEIQAIITAARFWRTLELIYNKSSADSDTNLWKCSQLEEAVTRSDTQEIIKMAKQIIPSAYNKVVKDRWLPEQEIRVGDLRVRAYITPEETFLRTTTSDNSIASTPDPDGDKVASLLHDLLKMLWSKAVDIKRSALFQIVTEKLDLARLSYETGATFSSEDRTEKIKYISEQGPRIKEMIDAKPSEDLHTMMIDSFTDEESLQSKIIKLVAEAGVYTLATKRA